MSAAASGPAASAPGDDARNGDTDAPGTLAWLRTRLLLDTDGDGFADTLAQPVWLASGRGPEDVDAAVAAAAELLTVLADGALRLAVDVRTRGDAAPGFAIGEEPLETPDVARSRGEAHSLYATAGARIDTFGPALHVSAADGAALYGAVTSWLDAARTTGSGTGGTGGTGDSLSSDASHRFAPSGGVAESLAVALRLALDHTHAPERIIAPFDQAAVRTAVDQAIPAGAWEVRRPEPLQRDALEIVGHDTEALRCACRWYADHYPRLADGTWIDDLEDRLTRLVRGRTREGRAAAAAAASAAARRAGATPTVAELPYPPASAPRWQGVPVRNSARDGARQHWSFAHTWEGERLLATAATLAAKLATTLPRGHEPLEIEAFASEPAPVRTQLAQRLAAAFVSVAQPIAEVRVRHAYRPALHWLLEEVEPLLTGAAALRVSVGAASAAQGAEDRWFRELYPVAELLEAQRPGLRVELALGPAEPAPRFVAEILDARAVVTRTTALAPLLADSPLTTGGTVPIAGGGLRVSSAGCVIAQVLVPTDAEAFWNWFAREVVPALTADLDASAEPHFHEIAIVAALSEPDERLALDHETDSVLEALHEDVYFGLLEAFDQALAADRPRRLNPGRILPFIRGRPERATTARVTVRAWGSDRIGVTTASGTFVAAPASDASVRLQALRGRGGAVHGLALAVDRDAAVERLEWASRACPESFPAGIAIRVSSTTERASQLSFGPFGGAADPMSVPRRPLLPDEVMQHVRALARALPSLRAAAPQESALGRPLPVLELGWPAGPAVSRARRAAWKPTVLVSCRQHANEATSTNAFFAWLPELLHDPAILRRVNLVVHPLENPDGAHLHAALCSIAPNHMHHAARYTAFGADLQAEPRVRGAVIGESLMRRAAAARWHPVLHLNNHGYPAHAWVRSQTGFVPRGFADWSLPVGHLTIVTTHGRCLDEAAAQRTRIAEAVADALQADRAVRERTRAQVERARRYRPQASVPFSYTAGFPFWLNHRPHPAATRSPAALDAEPTAALEPLVTIITEVPDETVAGDAWDACVRAHVAVNEAVMRTLMATLAPDAPRPTGGS